VQKSTAYLQNEASPEFLMVGKTVEGFARGSQHTKVAGVQECQDAQHELVFQGRECTKACEEEKHRIPSVKLVMGGCEELLHQLAVARVPPTDTSHIHTPCEQEVASWLDAERMWIHGSVFLYKSFKKAFSFRTGKTG
jgi:hypothetical protein